MSAALFRPLAPRWRMQKRWFDGRPMEEAAAEFIRPNDRLSSFERLEIYNRQYWFRVLDCLWDDYPGLRAIVGQRKFMGLITAYLARYPSDSYTLRDLGNRLERFLREEPQLVAPREELAIDMARFEWAQIIAFAGPPNQRLHPMTFLTHRQRRYASDCSCICRWAEQVKEWFDNWAALDWFCRPS
jgi:Putative DNA-binding domain